MRKPLPPRSRHDQWAEVHARPAASSAPPSDGHLLTAVSTSIVGILREYYGRGPMKADVLDDIVLVESKRLRSSPARKVPAFLSQAHVEPDMTMEIFFVDRPLDGFGALELVQP